MKPWTTLQNGLQTGVSLLAALRLATCFLPLKHKRNIGTHRKICPCTLLSNLTKGPHGTESRSTRWLSLMKKLARTNWGVKSKILKKVHTGNTCPLMEYGAFTWATAPKSNTNKLSKVQNVGMCITTEGLKTTPISSQETTIKYSSLNQRCQEKVLTHYAKLQKMPSHPVHQMLQERIKKQTEKRELQPPPPIQAATKIHNI